MAAAQSPWLRQALVVQGLTSAEPSVILLLAGEELI